MPTKVIDKFSGYYRFLNNFYLPAAVVLDGVPYPGVEHAYQAAKSDDVIMRAIVRQAATPGAAKRIGQRLLLRHDWEQVKLLVMEDLVRQKFTNHPELGQALLDTGDAELIEGNHWGDTFWGVCNGVGENHLGKILMKVRQELRHAQDQEAEAAAGRAADHQ